MFDFLNQLLLLQTVFCMMTLKFHDTYEVRDDADSISIISLFAIANILVVHRRDTKHSGLKNSISYPKKSKNFHVDLQNMDKNMNAISKTSCENSFFIIRPICP